MVVIIGMQGKPAAAEASVTLQSLRCAMCSPREVVPGSWDSGSRGLHRLPGRGGAGWGWSWWGGVDSDLCLHTGFLVAAAAAALAFHARLWCPS